MKSEVKVELMEAPQPQCRELSIKVEQVDMSMASSCDYSLSQFRDEDTLPVKKEEPMDDDDDDEYDGRNATHDTDFIAVDGGANSDYDDESDVPLVSKSFMDFKIFFYVSINHERVI